MNLIALNLKISFFNLCEYIKIVFKYYRYPQFLKSDLYLLSLYLFQGPFTISKKFHKDRGDEEIYVYGETPLTAFAKLVKEADISRQDVFFDLGCGRGRALFWLNAVVGCAVVGLEEIRPFVDRALRVTHKLHLQGVTFLSQDLLDADLSSGTVFYLYGNFMSDETLTQLGKKLSALPAGTKVITASFPISDYAPGYTVAKQFPLHYPWGWADVYICIKLFRDVL